MVGNRSYVACLSFFEPFTLVKKREELGEDFPTPNVSGDSSNVSNDSKQNVQMEAYYPKCLCLVSRFAYFDILKVCQLIVNRQCMVWKLAKITIQLINFLLFMLM